LRKVNRKSNERKKNCKYIDNFADFDFPLMRDKLFICLFLPTVFTLRQFYVYIVDHRKIIERKKYVKSNKNKQNITGAPASCQKVCWSKGKIKELVKA